LGYPQISITLGFVSFVQYSLLTTKSAHGSDHEGNAVERLPGNGIGRVFAASQPGPGTALTAWSNNLTFEALGNLAHELRTPIQALMGRLEMLQEEYADQIGIQPRELVQRMNVSAFELQQTLENLLAFVVAKAGAETGAAEHLTIESIVADVEPAIAAANADKRLDVRFDLERAPAAIRAPRRTVTATIINLALNAVKFTESGSVTIAIRRVPHTKHGDAVEIEVSDSGPGLSPALFEEMSQPFVQLSRSSTRRFRGVGLGLAIVRQNVTRLGGTVKLRSTPGHGASFLVRFPQPRTRRWDRSTAPPDCPLRAGTID
jgi:two-component system, sensor histidine kinase